MQPRRRTSEGQAAARAQAETRQLEDLRAQLEASRKQLQDQKSLLQQVLIWLTEDTNAVSAVTRAGGAMVWCSSLGGLWPLEPLCSNGVQYRKA